MYKAQQSKEEHNTKYNQIPHRKLKIIQYITFILLTIKV